MNIGNRITVGFGLSLLVLLVLATVAFQGARQLNETTEGLLKAHDNFRLVREVRALLVDAETGQRGFLLTGEEPYLEPYEAAISSLQQDMNMLRDAMAPFPDQRNRMVRLEPLVAGRLALLEEGIRQRREKGLEGSLTIVRNNRGKQLMDQIRGIINEMLAEEQEGWTEHSQAAEAAARQIMWVLGICTLLGILLVSAGSYLVTRSITVPLRKLMVGA